MFWKTTPNSLTKMSSISKTDLASFFKDVYVLSKQAEDEDDFIRRASDNLGKIVENLIGKLVGDKIDKLIQETDLRITSIQSEVNQAKDERISDLEAALDETRDKLMKLEKRMKSSENREKRNQKFQVANNIMVKTSSNQIPDKYLADLIKQGEGSATTPEIRKVIEVIPPRNKNKDKANGDDKDKEGDEEEPDIERTGMFLRVRLNSAQKKALFKGLAAKNKRGQKSGVVIQNEVPAYLRSYNRELERVSFTLRDAFKAEGLRTKICPDGLSLQMQFKLDGHKDWIKASSDLLTEKLDTLVNFRENEKKPLVIPSCRAVLAKKDNYA